MRAASFSDADYAEQTDASDPLRQFRSRFEMPQRHGQDAVYLCGNSLGLMCKRQRELVNEELDVWAAHGVEGHFTGVARPWAHTDSYVKKHMAEIVGAADESEVAVMNGLTTNLHLAMVAFYTPTAERFKILVAGGEFPSDRYAIRSQVEMRGFDPETAVVEVHPRAGEYTIRTEDIEAAIDPSIALVLFSGVHYYTGQLFQMQRIAAAAHKHGCRVGFDLAHAVGNAKLLLHDWDVDFAVWCSYKYLNSGPGGIAGLFIHKRLHEERLGRFAGWWGQKWETRFDMLQPFDPIEGADGFRLSNPPVLQVALLLASVDLFHEAGGMDALRAKSVKLTGYLEFLLAQVFSPEELIVITPSDPEQRGCQLSLSFSKDVGELEKHLADRGVICDVRKPNAMRIAPTPLYNSFQDVKRFVELLRELV